MSMLSGIHQYLRKSFDGFGSKVSGEIVATFLTQLETYKLLKKASLDFFKRILKLIILGSQDYEIMTETLLC